MEKIVYIGNFILPDKTASGKRVYGNSLLLKEIGYEVIFFGLRDKKENKKLIMESNCHYTFPKNNSILDYLSNKKINQFIKEFEQNDKFKEVKVILYYGTITTFKFVKKLHKFAKKNNILIVSDVVDILIHNNKNFLFNIIKKYNDKKMMTLSKNADGIITISNYLRSLYLDKNTVIIPPLSKKIKKLKLEKKHKTSEVLKLAYSGNPFRKSKRVKSVMDIKDRIDLIIESLYLLKKDNINFIFEIIGITREEIEYSIPKIKKYILYIEDNIVFHGNLPNNEAQKIISRADFTILIRTSNIQSNAGFPTKISESINLGVPVITTRTSDIDVYLDENKNVIFTDDNIDDIYLTLKRLSSLSIDDKNKLKINSFENEAFIPKNHVEKMKIFMDEIINKRS